MSFRRALFAFALSVSAPAAAFAQEARQVDIGYEITFAGFAGDAACDRTIQTNDGKRRIDIMIHKIGMESPAAAGVPTAKGDLLVCQLYTKRISGEFDEAPKEAEMERERPLKIWLARLDD